MPSAAWTASTSPCATCRRSSPKGLPTRRGRHRLSNDFAARFAAALNEDFDSHGAIAVLFELAGEVNRQRSGELAGLLKALAGIIGLLEREPSVYLRGGGAAAGGLDEAAIERMIGERAAAKKARNFAEADRLRDELKAAGVALDDSPLGTNLAASLK